jgi:tetratricopeptide (TPR) repeat protein
MAKSNWLTTAGERTGIAWGIVTKACLFAIGLFTVCVIVWQVVSECRYDGISMEPVVVKGPAGEGSPTVEMATQQIATYIDKIQRTGAREWRPHDLAESEQPGVSIQIPGSSLNVETIVRELAGMFPHRRRVLKISITGNPSGSGYVGAIAISQDGPPTRATCQTDERPGALGRMFECLAVEAMKAVDPLFAASYVLSVEKAQCAKFEPGHFSSVNAVAAEQRRLDMLREDCSFAHTRAVVSSIVVRGKTDDQPWVSYIYSKLHLARARALAKIDTEAQWYEFDGAISRFKTLSRQEVPASALATQLWVYIRNGLSIQESVLALDWKDGTKAEIIKHRLDTADKFLEAAARRLQHLTDGRQKVSAQAAFPVSAAVATQAKLDGDDPLGPMTSFMRGIILYRQWMIQAHRRKLENDSEFAVGAEEENQLKEAVKLFEASQGHAKHNVQFLMQWGNALRALRRFDDAITQYRQAADIAPEDYAPLLNVAVALLDKARGNDATLQARFDAMRQMSSYLTWISDGGPFTTLPKKIADALAGDGREAEAFVKCRQNYTQYEAEPEVQDMSHTAALKICVDKARDSLSTQIAEEEGQSTAAAPPLQ